MGRPVSIPRTSVHRITSTRAEADFEVWVAEPAMNPRVPVPDRLPVLWVVDADLFFGTAVELTRLMHQLFGELPPLLVVGIAYGTDDPAVQGEIRNRDLTPSSDAGFEAMARGMDANWQPLLPEGMRMGRADPFLDFLTEEVRPLIMERYPAADSGHALFGASLGGLFTLHAFLTRPGAFQHYIAGSPAIWWDGEMLFEVEEQAAAALRRSDSSGPETSLFMGVGALEEGVGMPWLDEFRTVTNVRRMAETLERRGDPSLRLGHHVFDGETHTTVVPAVLTRGLRMAYGRTG